MESLDGIAAQRWGGDLVSADFDLTIANDGAADAAFDGTVIIEYVEDWFPVVILFNRAQLSDAHSAFAHPLATDWPVNTRAVQ